MSSNTHTRYGRGLLAVTTTGLLVASAVAVGVGLTADTARAAPAGITECTTITEPGEYELRGDLSVRGETCLRIESSDVTVDGNGYVVRREAPDEWPENMSEYGEPPVVVVGGDDSVTNVSVRNASVVGESIYSPLPTTVKTGGIAYENVSNGSLTGIGLAGTLRVVGDDNAVSVRSSDYFEIDGDRNRLVDSTASVGDDAFEAISVSGRGNVLENVSAYGGPGLAVTGADTVVRNGTFGGVFTPAVELADAPNSSLIDSAMGGDGGLTVANSSGSEIRGNTLESGLSVVHSDRSAVLDNDVTGGFNVDGTDGATVRGNVIRGGLELSESASNLIYDNYLGDEGATSVSFDAAVPAASNAWNVSARPGTNVAGGDTVAGNYYGNDARGFSLACADADADGICDSPNSIGENSTDRLPLAAEGSASFPYFEVAGVDAPSRVDVGSGPTTVTATVTNVGTERATQTVTLSLERAEAGAPPELGAETVTLDPGETTTLTFEAAVGGLDATEFVAESRNSSYSTAVAAGYAGNYQVDFVLGRPIENLNADNLYAPENRLLRFAFGNTSAGVTERGSAWPNETIPACLDYGHVTTSDGWDTAEVTFEFDSDTFEGECARLEGALENRFGNALFSLAVYSMPGETFDADTAHRQELLTATTRVLRGVDYATGEVTLTVDLPDGVNATADPTARPVGATDD